MAKKQTLKDLGYSAKTLVEAGVSGIKNYNRGNKIIQRYAFDLPSTLPGYDMGTANKKMKEFRKANNFGGARRYIKSELESVAKELEKKGDPTSLSSAAYYRNKLKERYAEN